MSSSFRNFLITRILLTIPMILILVSLIFFIMRVLPGDPIRSQLGPRVSEEQADRIRERLGLNEPIMVQYVTYLRDMVTLKFWERPYPGRAPDKRRVGRTPPGDPGVIHTRHDFYERFWHFPGSFCVKASENIHRLRDPPVQHPYLFNPHLFFGFDFPDNIRCPA